MSDEDCEARLYSVDERGAELHACVVLVDHVTALDASAERLLSLAGGPEGKASEPGRLDSAIRAAVSGAIEVELAAQSGATNKQAAGEDSEDLSLRSPLESSVAARSDSDAPPAPPPVSGVGGLVAPRTDWRSRQLERQREEKKRRLAARAAAIMSRSKGSRSNNSAGQLVTAGLDALAAAALTATRSALSRALEAFESHREAQADKSFDRDIRARNCRVSLREALDACALSVEAPLWADLTPADAKLRRLAALAAQSLEVDMRMRQRELDGEGVCEFRDVVLEARPPLTTEEQKELEELREERLRQLDGWGAIRPGGASADELVCRGPTNVHHKILVVDGDELRLESPTADDVLIIERRRPPPRRRAGQATEVAAVQQCNEDSDEYE